MPIGTTLQAQSPGTAHADLGFWMQSQIIGQPMAMTEQHLANVVEQITANRFALPRNRQTGARITEKGTAIVEIHGVLMNRAPVLGSFWGLTAYEGLAEQFRRIETNADIKRVVLDIHSPGGVVAGIRGCAEALEKLAAKKPVHAIAHDMACSAAYWLAVVAEEISVTSDAMVGSIGVRWAHVSYAEMLERDGIQVHTFKAGAAKADGSIAALLSPGEAAERQFEIDRDYDRFVAHVAKHRPLSEDQVRDTDARCFTGQDAVAGRLADRVETLDDMVVRLEKSAARVKPKTRQTSQAGSKAGLAPAERMPARNSEPDDAPSAGKSKGAKLMSIHAAAEEANANLADKITSALVAIGARAVANADAGAAEAEASKPAAKPKPSADEQVAQAVEAERMRIFAILECDQAKAKPALALALAKAPAITLDAAKALIDAAPAPAAPAAQKADPAGNALERRMAEAGNAARIAPAAEGGNAVKTFSQLCGETAAKKRA